jgi:GDP-L-fucose synthase
VKNFWHRKKVLVTGASGFIGQNLVPILQENGCNLFSCTRVEYDLLQQSQVQQMFAEIRPDIVFHLAGLVGGILVNKKRPAEFCYQNMLMNTLVFHEAWVAGVQKFITCIGGCSYPKDAPSPITENMLWDGYPQPESAPYALAKRMDVVLSEAYRQQYGFNSIVLVPGNVYGPHDNFNLFDGHVIPAIIRKVYEAKQCGERHIVIWGSGKPIRDFVYVGDVVQALIHAAEIYDGNQIVNISSGQEVRIRGLVDLVIQLMDFAGAVVWDSSKPDGQMRKGFDVTRMQKLLNFKCRTSLEDGLRQTISWFIDNHQKARL